MLTGDNTNVAKIVGKASIAQVYSVITRCGKDSDQLIDQGAKLAFAGDNKRCPVLAGRCGNRHGRIRL